MTGFERMLLYVTAGVFWFVMLGPDEIVAKAIYNMICNLKDVTCND